jgi:autotransporter-associated beta strand protein
MFGMMSVERRDASNNGRPKSGRIHRMPMRALCRLLCAVPFALMLVMLGGAVSAFAQCTTVVTPLCSAQALDQENLLSPFNLLLNTPAGVAVLNANLQAEDTIYLNSTQAQKISSGTVLIPQLIYANILLRAFPANTSFGYTSAGLPYASALPSSVADAVNDIGSSAQLNLMKISFGAVNIYKNAYGLLPGQIDSVGNPPPYQVSAAIYGNPFTAADSSLLAYQNQQTQGAFGINWQVQADSQIGDFPSAHTIWGTVNAITFAILAPGYYQQLAQAAAEFSYGLNVNGVHYPTDVIGGRILATYMIAETLAGNSLYPSTTFTPGNLVSLSAMMQGYLGGGGSSFYAAACAGNVAGCIASGAIPTAATYAQRAQAYATYLTFGLPSVSDTTLAPVVPADAHWLIATRLPYLSTAQLNDVLATTELPSGGPIDSGTGWARLNLYAAASGYGAFSSNVTVKMNAALGGLNAFDVWSNNISGPGGLTLQGSGTLILAGNNRFTGDTVVQGGTLGVTGSLAGNLVIWSGASFAGNGAIGGSLTMLPGSTYLAAVGPNGANLTQVGGTATLSGSTVVVSSVGGSPALGGVGPILTAAGGISGSFGALIEPASRLASGTRFDVLYDSNAITLAVTPSFYGNLAAAGVAESSGESGLGSVLDAIRPGAGVALDLARSALFGPLYTLPAGSITTALDELAPSLYADAMITARNSWYLMADAVSGQLAARRGLAADRAANTAPGPNGSTIWVSALAGYDSIGAGGGWPGFTAGLGGTAAGIDVPVAGTARIGVAIGTVEGQTWTQANGNASSSTAQLVGYGQWQSGMVFAEAQLGLMYQQETVHRSLPLFGASTRGATDGLAGGGGVRAGVQQSVGGWLIEPSLGFGGFDLHMNGLTESGGALVENIGGGATLGSAESRLAVSAQRGFALSETVVMIVKGQLGWSHEFADNAASLSASFAGLGGSGFALTSAPIGRDAALVGIDADIKVASWPMAMFVGYGGAFSGSSNTQSFNAGVRFVW